MAVSFVSRFGCYTIIWDTTPRASRGCSVAVPSPLRNASRIGSGHRRPLRVPELSRAAADKIQEALG